jgi:predicted nucleic acid-binding protein
VIVVDTDIIAYLYLQGEHTTQVEKVLQKDSEWIAPLLWRSEFRNVLVFYLRQGHLLIGDAQAIMREAESLLQGREYSVSSARVLDLAAASRCSAYDCEFVSLAQDLEALQIPVENPHGLLFEAWQIARSYGRSVYDGLYVAPAKIEGCDLVTGDRKLCNAVSSQLPWVCWIGDFTIEEVVDN